MLQRNHLHAAHGSGIAGGITHTLPRRAEGTPKRCTTVIENKTGRLMVLVPANTVPGDYYLEVRTTFVSTSSKEAKTLKTGRYAKPVAVVAAS